MIASEGTTELPRCEIWRSSAMAFSGPSSGTVILASSARLYWATAETWSWRWMYVRASGSLFAWRKPLITIEYARGVTTFCDVIVPRISSTRATLPSPAYAPANASYVSSLGFALMISCKVENTVSILIRDELRQTDAECRSWFRMRVKPSCAFLAWPQFRFFVASSNWWGIAAYGSLKEAMYFATSLSAFSDSSSFSSPRMLFITMRKVSKVQHSFVPAVAANCRHAATVAGRLPAWYSARTPFIFIMKGDISNLAASFAGLFRENRSRRSKPYPSAKKTKKQISNDKLLTTSATSPRTPVSPDNAAPASREANTGRTFNKACFITTTLISLQTTQEGRPEQASARTGKA